MLWIRRVSCIEYIFRGCFVLLYYLPIVLIRRAFTTMHNINERGMNLMCHWPLRKSRVSLFVFQMEIFYFLSG